MIRRWIFFLLAATSLWAGLPVRVAVSLIVNPSTTISAPAGITFVIGTSAGSTTGNSVTTSAIDTTGSNFLAIWVAYDDFGSAPVITDSKSNTWTPLTAIGTSTPVGRFYYCENPNPVTGVGTGHTFTATGSFNFPTLCVGAWSGVRTSSSFDAQNGLGQNAVTSIQPGSITPSLNGELVLIGLGLNSADAASDPSGYSRASGTAGDGANHVGGFMDYKIQPTAGPENPTWTWTNSTTAVTSIACFKAP